MVGVGSRTVLKQQLSGLAGPRQRLQQVLHLVGGAGGGRQATTVSVSREEFILQRVTSNMCCGGKEKDDSELPCLPPPACSAYCSSSAVTE